MNFANSILYLNDDKSLKSWKWISRQKLENWGPQISLIPGGIKIWKCNFKVHFKGPHFAQVINPCEISISWTFIRHHVTKRSNHRFKLICNWGTTLRISHFRPFNMDLNGLYRKSYRQCKIACSEQVLSFTTITDEETLFEEMRISTMN